MSYAQIERRFLCELLDAAGPDAPTLCEGWTTHDLAAHLWVRENVPLAVAGILVPSLAEGTRRAMEQVKRDKPYQQLVAELRRGPVTLSPFAIPGLDRAANPIEFFIHAADVRRAGPVPVAPRELSEAFEDWLWQRLKTTARFWFRQSPVGVVLERSGGRTEGEKIRAKAGARIVTIVGRPGELMLYSHGRRRVAHVRLTGEPDDVTAVEAAPLGE